MIFSRYVRHVFFRLHFIKNSESESVSPTVLVCQEPVYMQSILQLRISLVLFTLFVHNHNYKNIHTSNNLTLIFTLRGDRRDFSREGASVARVLSCRQNTVPNSNKTLASEVQTIQHS